VAAVPTDGRRLSLWRHHHPAAARAGDRGGHSVAADVGAALSGDHRGAGRDIVDARPGRQPGSGIARTCIRPRPVVNLPVSGACGGRGRNSFPQDIRRAA
jgi:hypothetical protein